MPPGAPPTFVFVHGGGHDGRCWQPTVDVLGRLAPQVPVLAVDLPGRGRSPMPLLDLTIPILVQSVLDQIEAAGAEDVVLVGHSLAGITVPQVAAALGPTRVRRIVYVACSVPPDGGRILDVLRGPLRYFAIAGSRLPSGRGVPKLLARLAFCNGMTRAQREYVYAGLVAEAPQLTSQRVDRSQLDPSIPSTWVRTLRDHSLFQGQQRRSMSYLGIERCIDIDAPHDVMISHPEELARILLTEADVPVD